MPKQKTILVPATTMDMASDRTIKKRMNGGKKPHNTVTRQHNSITAACTSMGKA